jgi:uncharacterized repeat protein (TIGR01451 family)
MARLTPPRPTTPSTDRPRRRRRRPLAAVGAVALLATTLVLTLGRSEPATAANPRPVMTGYIPLNTAQFYDGLRAIAVGATNANFGTNLTFTVGITNAGAGAIITYDQWEDGFEPDPTTPSQASTLVFGDGNPANGNAALYCAACTGDLLPPGASLIMQNQIPRDRTAGAQFFDGGDKVLSTRGFTITAGGYPTTLGSVIAGVVSSYDTTLYRTEYTVPVAPDSPIVNGQNAFNYTAVLVQASEPNTVVEIDGDANGTYETSVTINEGQTTLQKVTKAGAKVRASAPVQVHLATGDTTATYESRWLTLFADADLASDYLSPAGAPDTAPTVNFLYNPSASPLVVNTTISGTPSVTIPAKGSMAVNSPAGTAVRFQAASGTPFAAVAAIGAHHSSNSSTWDWGATLVPYSRLTSQVILGWAPGNSAVPPSSASNNGSKGKDTFDPVWVTPAAATTIYVDYDGNPATGAVVAPTGHCMGGHYDKAITAAALQSLRVTNPSTADMTGARIYTCDGTKIAAAWGQDPENAPNGAPGFDAGYTVIPTTTLLVEKSAVVAGDVNGDGRVSPGDTVTYEIAVSNAGNVPFNEIAVKDVLKAGVTYQPGTTTVDDGVQVHPVADDVAPRSPFPLDEGGAVVPQITAGERVVVRFDVVVSDPYVSTDRYLDNNVCVEGVEAGATANPVLGCNISREAMPLADLELTKTVVGTAPTYLGDNVTYRVRVTNKGPDAATGVVVNDKLPTGLTFVSADPAVGTYDETTGDWQVGTLTNGQTRDLLLTAKATASPITNYAQITHAGAVDPDSTPSTTPLGPTNPPSQDDEAAVTTTLQPAADLELTKRVVSGPNAAGLVVYEVTLTNRGPSTATNILVDERPTSVLALNYAEADTTGPSDQPDSAYQFKLASLAPGASKTWNASVVHRSFPAGNTVEVMASDQHDPDSTPNNHQAGEDDQATVTVTRKEADLRLTKVASSSAVVLGGTVDFTLTVTNDGPDDATGVVVTDQLPSGLTYRSQTGDGTYDAATGRWTVGNVANGASASIRLTARVDAIGSLVNRAQVSASDQHDPDSTPNNSADPGHVAEDDESSATVTSTGATIGDLVWTDLDGDGVVDPGESGIAGVTVTLSTVDSGGALTTVATTTTGPDGTYRFSNLPPGTYRVVVTTPAGVAATTATSKDVALEPGQIYLDADVGFRPEADLSLTKTIVEQPTHVGGEALYRLTVSNAGPAAATGVVVRDRLPAGLTHVSDTGAGSYVPATGDWTVGTIAAGASVTLDVRARVGTTDSIVNTAEIIASDLPDPDSTPGNHVATEDDQDSAQIQVDALIDLDLQKTLVDPVTHVGQTATYRLTVGNAGPSIATGVTVSDRLPTGLTYVDSTGDGTYDPDTGVWDIGTIAVDGDVTITITATVTGAGRIENTAEVATANEHDADSTPANANADEDDLDTVVITPRELIDLSVTNEVVTTPTHIGDQATFEVVVTNDGPSTATGVKITDKLPAGLTYVSDTGSGSYDPETGIWTVGDLAPGESVTLRIVAIVTDTSVTTTAQVTAADQDDVDSTPGNDVATEDDQASAPVTVRELIDLSVTNQVVTTPTHIGDQATFEVVVTNDGPSTATGVKVTDKLPAGLTYVSDTGSGSYDPETGIWTVGDLAPGESVTLRIVAIVTDTSVTTTAQVTAADQDDVDSTPGNDVATEDDQASAPVTVRELADLSLVKSLTDTPTHVGDTATYTVALHNAGPSVATGVTVADKLPAGLTHVSDSSAGSYDPAAGVWTVGTLAVDATVTLTITTSVTAAGQLRNVAQVASSDQDDPDSTPGNHADHPDEDDGDDAVVDIRELADLSISKTVSSVPTHLGQNATFEIVVRNDGPSAATGVTVSDRLPTGLVYVSDDGNGAYDDATGIWTVGTLAVDGTATLHLVARVDALSVANVAQVASSDQDDPDSTPGNGALDEDDLDLVTVTVSPQIDLEVQQALTTPPVHLGDEATITVTLTNKGPSNATGVEVTDRLPAGLTWLSDDSGGAYDPETGIWNVGTVNADGTRTLTIRVRVDALTTVNHAEVTAADQDDIDSTPGENPLDADHAPDEDDESALPITVAPLIDLSLHKSSTPATVNQLEQATFTLAVTNDGPSPATGVVVTDQLPAGVEYVSHSGGTYDPATGLWTIGDLDVDATAELDIVVHVSGAGPITNRAQVTAADQDDVDSTPGNGFTPDHATEDDEDTTILSSQPMIDLDLTTTVDVPTAHVGDRVTFTVQVGNDGPSPATGVRIQDRLPAGVTLVSATPSVGTYDPETGIWTVGDLDVGDTATITFVTEVTAPGPLTNRAQVVAADQDDVDSTPGNVDDPGHVAEDDEDAVTVEGVQIDLSLTNAFDKADVNVGDTVTYTITVRNDGYSGATGVVVDGTLPPGISPEQIEGPGSYDPETGRWVIGDLAPGQTATLTILARVTAGGPITATAQVHAANEPDVDSTPGNDAADEDDQSTATLTGGQADLSLRKVALETRPVVGTKVVYELTVSNAGPTAAGSVTVLDQLPAGLTYVSHEGHGSYETSTGIWTVPGPIASGDTATVKITATVDTAAKVTNEAEILSSDRPDPNSTPGNGVRTEDDMDSATITPISARLEGTLWVDKDGDGRHDRNEPPIPGVTVNLYSPNGDLVASTVTGPDGRYVFEGLAPGRYYIEVDRSTLPATVDGQTIDPDDVLDGRHEVVLAAGDNLAGLDFGFAPAGTDPDPDPDPEPTTTTVPGTPTTAPGSGPTSTTTPPSGATLGRNEPLPRTGIAIGGMLTLAVGLITAGAVILVADRRRKAT